LLTSPAPPATYPLSLHDALPICDTHRVALLEDRLYHPDGQIRDEVYEYGSFLQSKMFNRGVTCSDCHDPHSGKLRAPGSQVCLRSEEHTSELQSRSDLVCRLLLE